MPTESPAQRPLFEIDGSVYHFTDIPLNRGMLSVSRHFPENGIAVMTRLLALHQLADSEEFKQWSRAGTDPGSIEIHPLVIELAATFPFNQEMWFDAAKFFLEVRARESGAAPRAG